MSRYSQVYRDMGAGELGKAVLQYSHSACDTARHSALRHGACAHDTTVCARRYAAMRAAQRTGGRTWHTATIRPLGLRHGTYALRYGLLGTHDTMLGRLRHCHARVACVHRLSCGYAPVFDSVLFLSHFLGTIHEHCS